MFYGGISAETQPFFVANSVIFSHAFHMLYLLKFTYFGLYSDNDQARAHAASPHYRHVTTTCQLEANFGK
jgi:hypothetical protein